LSHQKTFEEVLEMMKIKEKKVVDFMLKEFSEIPPHFHVATLGSTLEVLLLAFRKINSEAFGFLMLQVAKRLEEEDETVH